MRHNSFKSKRLRSTHAGNPPKCPDGRNPK